MAASWRHYVARRVRVSSTIGAAPSTREVKVRVVDSREGSATSRRYPDIVRALTPTPTPVCQVMACPLSPSLPRAGAWLTGMGSSVMVAVAALEGGVQTETPLTLTLIRTLTPTLTPAPVCEVMACALSLSPPA